MQHNRNNLCKRASAETTLATALQYKVCDLNRLWVRGVRLKPGGLGEEVGGDFPGKSLVALIDESQFCKTISYHRSVNLRGIIVEIYNRS